MFSPMLSSSPPPAPPAKNARRAEQPRRSDRKRILIVEDNKDSADALAQLIGLLGCDVDVANNGRSAVARAIAFPPGLILCDLGLPGGMDGYAVAREVRGDPRLREPRLVAVSGYSRTQDHAAAEQAGSIGSSPSPSQVDIIEAMLNDLAPRS